jgi:hypothetical protein
VLAVDGNPDAWRYVNQLLGRDPDGDRRRCGAIVMSPDEAEMLVENGLHGVAPAALLLVDQSDADATAAAIDRGAREAALAHAGAIVLRTRDAAVWLSARDGRALTLSSALAALPTVSVRELQARPGPPAWLASRWARVAGAVVVAAAGAGAGIAAVRHFRGAPVAVIPAVSTTAPTVSADELVPRPSTAMLAYDGAHRALVLVGCCDRADIEAQAITWTWSGTSWQPHHDVAQPTVVGGSSAISEGPAAGPVVLFDTNAGADTWTWSGSSWTLLDGFPSPPDGAVVMAYDRVSHAVVATVNSDTWTWDNLGWHSHTGRSPGFGSAGDLATDPATGRVIEAVDPSDGTGSLALYRWTGSAWVAVPATGGPGVEFGFQIAGDDASGDIVYLGPPVNSFYPDLVPDTWVWDGHTWSHPPVDATPTHSGRLISAFGRALFVEDAVGGRQPAVWTWAGRGWHQVSSADGLALASRG